MEEALNQYEKININEGYSKLLINGVKVGDRRMSKDNIINDNIYRVYDENNVFLGLGRRDDKGFKIEKLQIT